MGVGGGDSYHWYSHKSVIDDKAAALIPNMTVYTPETSEELSGIMRSLPESPSYIKIL